MGARTDHTKYMKETASMYSCMYDDERNLLRFRSYGGGQPNTKRHTHTSTRKALLLVLRHTRYRFRT